MEPTTDSGPGRNDALQIACLEVRGQRFGIDVRGITEVVRAEPPAPLPQAPPLIEGVLDLRGALVPIVDLGRALHDTPSEPAPHHRIVVLEAQGLRLGLRVEAALGVLSLEAEAVGPPPDLAMRAGYDLVRAVARPKTGPPVLVLSVERLLHRIQNLPPSPREALRP